jgi:hypothetical protein
MKFVEPSQFTDPETEARRLSRSPTGSRTAAFTSRVNGAFLEEGGTPDQYRAALAQAIKLGWLWLHESGTYVKFTPAGADLFA